MRVFKQHIKIVFAAFFTVMVFMALMYSCANSGKDKTDEIYETGETEEIEEIVASADYTEPVAAADTTETVEIVETVESTEPPVKINGRVYQEQFDVLRDRYGNDDIIGIIKIPGTTVYYPVAHNSGDNEYYLGRNLYGQLSSAGSICMDYENSVGRYDPNTILYGHQMYSESMFHTLSYYMDGDFFDSHRYVIFNTIYENNVWEVFSFFKTYIDFNYIKVFFKSEEEFLELASAIKDRSIYETDIEINQGDRILCLSTCTNEDPDTRYVLAARMVKNKDDIPADIAEQMLKAVEDYE